MSTIKKWNEWKVQTTKGCPSRWYGFKAKVGPSKLNFELYQKKKKLNFELCQKKKIIIFLWQNQFFFCLLFLFCYQLDRSMDVVIQ